MKEVDDLVMSVPGYADYCQLAYDDTSSSNATSSVGKGEGGEESVYAVQITPPHRRNTSTRVVVFFFLGLSHHPRPRKKHPVFLFYR